MSCTYNMGMHSILYASFIRILAGIVSGTAGGERGYTDVIPHVHGMHVHPE